MKNILKKLRVVFLCIGFIFCVGVQAQSIYGKATPSIHTIKFRIHQDVAAGLSTVELGRRLGQYVADINEVYRRETVRSFKFDPLTDIQITAEADCNGGWGGEWQNSDYIVLCIKNKSTIGYSHGGNSASSTNPVRGFTGNYEWIGIHDPTNLSTAVESPNGVSTQEDYLTRQLRTLIHEIEHVFGAGTQDIYQWSSMNDQTGVPPINNVGYDNPQDQYWLDRKSWRLDPLMGALPAVARHLYLSKIKFTPLTKAVINTNWDPLPQYGTSADAIIGTISPAMVNVVDRKTGNPIQGATVMIWKANSAWYNNGHSVSDLTHQGMSNAQGKYSFNWACTFNCSSPDGGTVLIKVWRPGYTNSVQWFTYHDILEQITVQGKNQVEITFRMEQPDTTPPVINSFTTPSSVAINSSIPAQIRITELNFRDTVVMVDGLPTCQSTVANFNCGWTPIKKGNQFVQLITRDYAGNVTISSKNINITSTGDDTAPTLVINPPQTAVLNQSIRIRPQITDNVATVGMQIYINGKYVGDAQSSLNFHFSWTFREVGYHNIELRALDSSGNNTYKSFGIRVSAS